MKIIFTIVIFAVFTVMQAAWAGNDINKGAPLNDKKVLIKQLLNDNDYQPLLEGEKNSVKMEAGRVVKLRGQKGTPHSTQNFEEILVVLKGKGAVNIEGKEYIVKEGEILYIPPRKNHQITNNLSDKFEYLYVAAPAIENLIRR